MAKPITAYQSDDGRVHSSLEEAEFCDYSMAIRTDVRDFAAQEKLSASDSAAIIDMIVRYELWKIGGYNGWLATREAQAVAPHAPPAPPAAPPSAAAPVAPAAPPPAPPPEPEPQPQPDPFHAAVIDAALGSARIAQPVQRVIQPARPAPAHPARAPRSTPDSNYRRRVAVVGLQNEHHRAIEKEFCDEFKLLLLDYANSMAKLESLKQYHKVIVMTRHAHPKTLSILRQIGQEPLQVHGDVDALRETLTGMYVADSA